MYKTLINKEVRRKHPGFMKDKQSTARLCCTPLVWSLSPTPFILRVPRDPAEAGPQQPRAAVCLRPHQEGSVIRGKVWESPVLVSVRELPVLSPSWDSGHRGQGTVCSSWWGLPGVGGGAQEGVVLTLSIKQHVFNFNNRPLKTHFAWGRSQEEERTGVRHGSFPGKVIFSVDSQSVLPEMPFSGLANRVWLWSVLSDSCTCTHPGPSIKACRLYLDPVPPWPGSWPLWGRSPWHHPGQGFTPTGWRRSLSAAGQLGLFRAHLDALSALCQPG